jgi:DNA polymerase III sliding clamp (beta) subunit (PCNA family)
MRGIGDMARASGLTVSALRFYDGVGLLVPAFVDPVTGYRRYAEDQLAAARLIAGLRRVGMPLSEITSAGLPMLGGILLDTEDGDLTLVATDRYRLATARTAAGIEGPPGRTLLPLELADAVRPLLTGDGPVVCTAETERVVFEVAGHRLEGAPIDAVFPDHRPLVRTPDPDHIRRLTIDADAVRAAIAAGPDVVHEAYPVVVLNLDAAEGVRCADENEWLADENAHVAVNREFLLQALDAGGRGQLALELDGPIHPLRR